MPHYQASYPNVLSSAGELWKATYHIHSPGAKETGYVLMPPLASHWLKAARVIVAMVLIAGHFQLALNMGRVDTGSRRKLLGDDSQVLVTERQANVPCHGTTQEDADREPTISLTVRKGGRREL